MREAMSVNTMKRMDNFVSFMHVSFFVSPLNAYTKYVPILWNK